MIKTFYFNDLATLSPPYGDGIGRIKSLSRLQQFSPPYGDGIKNVKTTELATLFSPPCGDCTLCTKFYHAPAEFSPPCGDGTEEDMTPDEFAEFSPPYGDGITFPVLRVCSLLFSPPYGDGILNISQNTAKLKSRMARKYSLYYNDVPLHCKERSQIHSACLVRGAVSWYDADNGSYKKECCPVLKTYITTVPLQGKLDPMLYQREHAAPPTATCFPIVQVMRDTLEPGDTVQLLAIRQENADTARNYQRLLEELAQLGIAENQVRQLHLPEDQRPETLIGLCRDLVDALPQVTRVYACITYGSKSIPVVTLTSLTCAEATHTELEVGGVYYGEVKRENGQVLSARLYDMAALYQLAGLVGTMRDSKTAEQVFHQLIWMNERRED